MAKQQVRSTSNVALAAWWNMLGSKPPVDAEGMPLYAQNWYDLDTIRHIAQTRPKLGIKPGDDLFDSVRKVHQARVPGKFWFQFINDEALTRRAQAFDAANALLDAQEGSGDVIFKVVEKEEDEIAHIIALYQRSRTTCLKRVENVMPWVAMPGVIEQVREADGSAENVEGSLNACPLNASDEVKRRLGFL